MSKRKINLIKNKDSMTNLIRKAFLREGYKKKSITRTLLKCNWDTLKIHIEEQFDDEMNWDNRGRYGWHVDHIIPLYHGKTKLELMRLNHYLNLKPMWYTDNLVKNRNVIKTELSEILIIKYSDILNR